MASPAPDEPAAPDGDERPLPAGVVVAVVLWLTLLLSVWGAFLSPFRVGSVLVPLWLVPLAVMIALAWAAARRAGLWGALAPALLWLTITYPVFGVQRPEGDLVVPATTAGYAYLFGGAVPWLVVVARASADKRAGRPARAAATPAEPARR